LALVVAASADTSSFDQDHYEAKAKSRDVEERILNLQGERLNLKNMQQTDNSKHKYDFSSWTPKQESFFEAHLRRSRRKLQDTDENCG
jgi:hypothetical protein